MMHILYVDDDPSLLEIGRLFLERTPSFTVSTALSASDALQMLAKDSYDAIVSDYEMPGVNGIAFLQEVRARHGDLPFILFTGKGREEIVIQAINNGADFYLQKGGAPAALFAELIHKITKAIERRQALEALKNSERRLTDIINFLPDATFAIDREGTVIAWNKAIEAMTGVPAASMLGKGDYAYAVPFYGERRPILIDLILAPENDVINHEYAILEKEGSAIAAEATATHLPGVKKTLLGKASRLYDKHGTVVGAIESIRDISDRKLAEERLKKERDFVTAIMDTIGAFIIVLDRDGRIVQVNHASEQLGGYSFADIKGHYFWEYLQNPDEKDWVIEEFRQLTQGTLPSQFQNYWVAKHSAPRFIDWSNTILRSDTGTVEYVIGTGIDITEQKQTEMSLRQSNEHFFEIVHNAPYAIFHSTLDGKVLDVNPAGVKFFGFDSEAEMLATVNSASIPDVLYEDPQSPRDLLNRALESGTLATAEGRYRRKDGTIAIGMVAVRVYTDPITSVSEVEGFIEDITERTCAEEALRRSEEQYRNVVEDQTEFISRFLPNGTHIFVNDAYCRYFGKKRDEIMGKRFVPAIPTEDRAIMKAHFAMLSPANPVASVVHRIVMPNGQIRWQRWSDRAIFDENGRIVEYQSVGQDITESKQVEEALKENEEKYRALVETSFDGILIHQQGRIVYANSTALRLIGADQPDALMGKPVLSFVHPDDQSLVAQRIEAAPHTELPVVSEKFLRIDGSSFMVDVTAKPFTWHGQPAAYVIFRDISDRKKAEAALLHANWQLSMLASVTRHDIRNKLTIMRGLLAIAGETATDPAMNEMVQKITSLAVTIDDQIEFTRVYENLGSQKPQWQALRTTMPSREVPEGIVFDTRLDTMEIFADPMLPKVFSNLLDNSLRHGDQVSRIRVTGAETDRGLMIRWEDNGIGIAAADKDRVFNRGYGENTGLGLFLVREILALTGISIEETGEPGTGARFDILVPKEGYRHSSEQSPKSM